MTDDPTWDAAASDRFNATLDAGVAERDLLSTFRRLLAVHGEPVMLELPPDIDPTLRDALIAEGRTNPSVIVVDRRNLAPMLDHAALVDHGSALHDALRGLNIALDHLPPMEVPVLDISTNTVAALTRPPALPRTARAPKPPPEVQDNLKAAAEDRRERKRIRNLVGVGHTYGCASVIVLCGSACTCGFRP